MVSVLRLLFFCCLFVSAALAQRSYCKGLAALAAIFPGTTPSPPPCPANEEYSCCGTCVEPYCKNRKVPVCLVCAEGCFCKSGFIREVIGGKCITPKSCPK
uniref:TIL domain-containing protein n=1 Tax=Anopheles atroparvus TaxID=41427 RepID=A0AAG5CS25_ANOAO